MDFIRTCDVYPTTRCNCPERTCRRQQAEDELLLERTNELKRQQHRLEDLIDFQLFLLDRGLINNTDWAYEDLAQEFINQNLKNERN